MPKENTMSTSLDKLIEDRRVLLEALKEISQGKGRYDRDRLKHAENTIEDMKQLANAAIKQAEGK